jgi:hypothetical protein
MINQAKSISDDSEDKPPAKKKKTTREPQNRPKRGAALVANEKIFEIAKPPARKPKPKAPHRRSFKADLEPLKYTSIDEDGAAGYGNVETCWCYGCRPRPPPNSPAEQQEFEENVYYCVTHCQALKLQSEVEYPVRHREYGLPHSAKEWIKDWRNEMRRREARASFPPTSTAFDPQDIDLWPDVHIQ